MRGRAAVALLLVALGGLACAANKLPEVPDTLTPQQADAFLAKLTDAQARALLAQQLRANAMKRASPPPGAERGFGALVLGLAEKLETTQLDVGKRSAIVAQGSAMLPAALASGPAVFGGNLMTPIALLAAVLLIGIGAAWAVRRGLRTHGLEPQISPQATGTARLSAGVLRFVLDLLPLGA